ncbi:MAG TPA: hypothetical protein PLO62_11555 [Candidatus Hydrogenedentes bacterium]|nr:hypothetical protein [Candidatus Hydrogenedentota bacterium]HOS01650.1 hypothetical protein [Candidatus Hydrogenedentota bacterium]
MKVAFESLPMRQCGIWRGAGPLTPREQAFGRRFVREVVAACGERDGGAAPILLMRIEDVLASYWLVGRLESLLWNEGVMIEKAGDAAKPATAHPALEAAGKARERLRKALTELESALHRAEPARQTFGVADLFRPLLMKAEGVYEASLGEEDGGVRDDEAE